MTFHQTRDGIAAIVIVRTQILQGRVRTSFVVVESIGFDDGARFIQLSIGIEWHFGAQGAMHPLVFAIRLRMIGMRAHVRHSRGLHELRPLVTNELRSAIVHDLGFAGTPLASQQSVQGTLFGTDDVLRGRGNQHFAVDQVAAVGIQDIEQPIPLLIEIPHTQVGVPALIGMIRFRWATQQFGCGLPPPQEVGGRKNLMHHPGIQKRLFFQHQTVGHPLVAQTEMRIRESMDALHFRRGRRNRFAMRRDNVIGQLLLARAIRPAMIGRFWQTQVPENGGDPLMRTTRLRQGNRRQNLGFLVAGVTALRSDYQRPFFSRKFSLEISAITSRRRWISVTSASSLGRNFLRPRG